MLAVDFFEAKGLRVVSFIPGYYLDPVHKPFPCHSPALLPKWHKSRIAILTDDLE